MNSFLRAILPQGIAQSIHRHVFTKWCDPYSAGVIDGIYEQKRYCVECHLYEIRRFTVEVNLKGGEPK